MTGPAGEDGTPGTTVTIKAGDSVNNVEGNPVDRITAGGQTIATMSDGQKYAGDNAKADGTNVISKKLNEQLDIVGGADADKLTENNIGVNNVNGQLKVQLVKDIDLGTGGSVTMGNTVVNNSGVAIGSGDTAVTLTDKGLNNGGNQITNVASGSDGVDADGNPTYNTTTNAANIGDLKNVNDALVNKGMDFTADSGDTVHRDLGEALGIVGDGQNITTTTDPTNGNITVALSNDLSIGAKDGADGTDGVDGKIGVNGKDGSSVVINGADGSIGLTGPAGADGTQTTVTIAAGDSVNNVDGTPVDRITAGGQTIATMSDGQKYAGDNAKADGTNVISKKLNEQLDIVGGADADKLTENNIGVNNVNGQLKVQLAQNIDLGKDGSVTMGNTVVNNSGLTIANGPSVTSSGINAGGSKITNVAAGDVSATSTDAVNGSQLKDVQDIAEKHTKVTVEGGTEAGTTDYAGNNLQLKATTVDGQTTYDLKLADNLSIGEKGADGKDGVDGSIGVNGKDGSSVVINGTDGISIKGADGKDGVSITGKDGVDGVDGLEGHIGLNGKDGMTDIYTTPGQPGVNGKDGETMTRIIYTDPNGANHEVATLDDGMKYTGDTGSAAVALNKTVNIVGGETDSTKLSTDNNIGIVAEQADDNAKLTVRLAKDITGLNTVTAGDATIGNQTEVTAGGVAQTGSYVTGLDNTEWNMTSPDIVSGRAATEDQLKTVTDTVNALADGTSENATGGFGLTDDSGTAVKQDIGKTIQIAGDGNITTTADATSGKLTVGLSNTIALGEKASEDGTTEGADSSITVNGKDGSSVAINGADGTIALNTADGSPVTIAAGTQVNNLAGTPIDRITVGGATVATLDDGMKYYGDFGDVASVKLNNQVNVKGEANSEDDLTTGNIGVVSAQDGDNALLTVKLNKDINLGSTGSVTTGNTVINNSGVTITPTGGNPVTLTDAGLNNGSNKITNVAPGAINEDSMDAVNGSQLNEIRKLAGQHTYVTVEGGIEGDSAEYAGKNLLLQAKRDNNLTTYYDLKLSDNITLGSANDSEGTGGVDSSITLNGAAGSSVAINGGDGSIALTGANGSTATIAAGTSTPNLAGTAIDRITAGGSTVATLDDGMKYGGDFGDTSKVKLNNQVNVKGNAKNEADLTDGNIGVVSSQDGDNGQLLIKLNKDLNLGDTGSVTMGNTVINNGGVTIGSGTSAVTLTDKGLNNGGNQITNVASGTTGKTYDTSVAGQENYNNAANIGDLTTAINDVKNADNGGGFGLTADDGKSVKQDLGSTITVTGDNNIETKVTDDGKLQVGLKDNVDLGQNGSITAGNTTIDKDGVSTDKIAIKDSGISIDKDGINAGNTVIKDVGSGLGNTYDTSVAGQENYNNGANIGDVYNIAKGQADAVKAQSGKNITVGDDNKVNLNDNITLGDTTDPSKQVNIDGNGATVTAGSGDNQVKLDGSKGQISAGGAVLGNQENTANDGNPATGNYLTGLDNTKWDSNNIQSGRAATEDQLKVVDDKVNKGRVFQGDDGADNSVTVGLGDTLKLNGGADTSKLSSGNIGVVRNSSGDGLDIKLAKDLKDLDSVTTGNTTINDNGVTIKTVDSDRTITIQDSNVNMGNNVVSGVADGTVAPGSTEAINGGQLALRDQAINHLGGEVNKLDNRINRVGAGAAALAALHPQDFDPDDKWDFAFGYGHYRGANAGAFGAFYKPNEDTTFSVGGTIGGGENMINAGVSFKLGQGNNVSNSRVGMAKEIKHLRDDVAKLEDIVNRQSQMINQLTGQNPGTIESKGSELFPDVPANHWAYEYVTKLHQLGIIEGYPDGNFDGNRMMTRYEFAAVVYRAIMAGAASNAALQGDDTLDRLANEFSAELKYIRIDTIAKDKDGKPTIQRVRIVPENKQN
ncbi:S-layer homology domain-containing protein [uncultured Megasphaera sp.]|uniref:S-layer homology domain-containing protein n=1 Tax=uncultured Megasphaera sp. TaxID=165188 RepID=UPI00266C5B77|nr:S-layer homology domain-containing protein [uncultured Megasphaera sp.]